MQRDLKIGLLAGLIIAGAAMVYVCTRPSFSPRAQVLKASQKQYNTEPAQPARWNITTREVSRITEPPIQTQSQHDYQQQVISQTRTNIIESYIAEPKPSFAQKQVQTEPSNYISEEKIKATRFYIVRHGDTLSKISKMYYGSASDWYKIYQANRNVLKNPDLVKPGTKLIIPD